ncbi:terpene synthase [Streptomyces flaveolus]|uniref:terpene synthase family protein n=1 Tax=Streptomyces flaveolus TaxID=67297 RepID=UPI0034242CD2
MSTSTAGSSAPGQARPTFWHLFPSRSNALGPKADYHASAWLDDYRLTDDEHEISRLKAFRVGSGMGCFFPDAQQDLLDLAADLCLWLCAFDDLHVEAPQATVTTLAPHLASFTYVLDTRTTPPAPPSLFTPALADLTRRIHELTTPAQAARCATRLHQAFLGMLWDTTTRGRTVRLAEYKAMRSHSVFSHAVAALIEPCAGLDLPAEAHDTEQVRQLIHSTALLSGWVNDVYSFPKERHESGFPPQTLPLILAREHGLALPEAFAAACHLCDQEAFTAYRLITELTASPRPPTAGLRPGHQPRHRWHTGDLPSQRPMAYRPHPHLIPHPISPTEDRPADA